MQTKVLATKLNWEQEINRKGHAELAVLANQFQDIENGLFEIEEMLNTSSAQTPKQQKELLFQLLKRCNQLETILKINNFTASAQVNVAKIANAVKFLKDIYQHWNALEFVSYKKDGKIETALYTRNSDTPDYTIKDSILYKYSPHLKLDGYYLDLRKMENNYFVPFDLQNSHNRFDLTKYLKEKIRSDFNHLVGILDTERGTKMTKEEERLEQAKETEAAKRTKLRIFLRTIGMPFYTLKFLLVQLTRFVVSEKYVRANPQIYGFNYQIK